jgi:LPS-assembly protein
MLRLLIITGLVACHSLFGCAQQMGVDQLGSPAGSAFGSAADAARPGSDFATMPGGDAWARPVEVEPQRQKLSLPTSALKPGESVVLQADEETVSGTVYTASGDVQIDYGDIRLTADRITYDSSTGEAIATGRVAFDDAAEATHVEGTRGLLNLNSSTGEFDNFRGESGVQLRTSRATLQTSNPVIFSGRRLLRLGPNKYRLENGTLTTCHLPNPKWVLSASRVDVELGNDATLHDAVFRLYNLPVFYAPYLTHSIKRTGRHSGFLMPTLGNGLWGTVVGDAFYWAPNRSNAATFGGDYYSQRGWADHLELDSDPTRNSTVRATVNGVFDRGLATPTGARLKQGGQEARLVATDNGPDGFHTVVDGDYLSSFIYRLTFNETFSAALNSEVVSTAFTERQWDGYDFSVVGHRYQNFLAVGPRNAINLIALPSVRFGSLARDLGRRIYFSWDTDLGELDRLQPAEVNGATGQTIADNFNSGFLSRFLLAPRVTAPLDTSFGDFTLSLGERSVWYSKSESPQFLSRPQNGEPAGELFLPAGSLAENSGSLDVTWDLPPISRVFSTRNSLLGDQVEHVIEPQISFRDVTGIHDFNDIIRFDGTDVLTDTRELDYGITQRLLGKRNSDQSARDLVSWTLSQKYFFDPTFGGALRPGTNPAMLATTAELSPFLFETYGQKLSPVSSVVRISPWSRFDGDWRIDLDPIHSLINASAFTGTFHVGDAFFQGSHFLVREPAQLSSLRLPLGTAQPVNGIATFNQLRFATGYGNADTQGLSAGLATAYDAELGVLQYAVVQTTYNWDCCGFSVEYRRFAITNIRHDNLVRVMFSLANVGSFGNLKRQERIIF